MFDWHQQKNNIDYRFGKRTEKYDGVRHVLYISWKCSHWYPMTCTNVPMLGEVFKVRKFCWTWANSPCSRKHQVNYSVLSWYFFCLHLFCFLFLFFNLIPSSTTIWCWKRKKKSSHEIATELPRLNHGTFHLEKERMINFSLAGMLSW